MADSFVVIDGLGPSFTPLRYGILSVAPPTTTAPGEPGDHWRMGFQRQPLECAGVVSMAMIPCITGAGDITENEGEAFVESVASDVFRVFAVLPCAPVGYGDDLADLRNRTTALLTNHEIGAVDQVFWQGATSIDSVPYYPHLASDTQVLAPAQGAHRVVRQRAAEVLTSAAVDLVEALGLVEMRLSQCYGGEGIIHVPREALPALDFFGVVHVQGQQLRTLAGNYVAAYSGVPAGPDGSVPDAGSGWIYGTGMATVLRGQVSDLGRQSGEIVGRAQNDTFYVVTRDYSWSFDCCLVAAEVELAGASA